MTEPSKHHFNPAFSLKPWAGADGNVCQMRKIGGRVFARRTHPNATGFQKDLYKIDGVSPDKAQYLEKAMFQPLDTDASDALEKILKDDRSPWDARLHTAWTRYILSLLFRTPAAVATLKSHVMEMFDAAIKEFEADYENRRRPTDPPIFSEYAALMSPAAPQIGAANLLIQIIDNPPVAKTIFGMRWHRIALPNANHELLYSDRPIFMPLGLGDPKAFIALPVAPRVLFLAVHDAAVAQSISSKSHTAIVKEMNRTVVTQAREFVWGTSDSQLPFVQKHMGTIPDRPLITPEQRAQAVVAARGE